MLILMILISMAQASPKPSPTPEASKGFPDICRSNISRLDSQTQAKIQAARVKLGCK